MSSEGELQRSRRVGAEGWEPWTFFASDVGFWVLERCVVHDTRNGNYALVPPTTTAAPPLLPRNMTSKSTAGSSAPYRALEGSWVGRL